MRKSVASIVAKRASKEPSETLSEAVRSWRGRLGISATQGAERLGMPVRTLEGIEQGRPFRYEKILRLALKCS